ncbi:hypothetical protein C4J81_16425 [Deltaproteobacteria bacterium Smac51]|nr:hypothetical protein C4J81_16425 [Deltaproteobacteria bacterium Smac51]
MNLATLTDSGRAALLAAVAAQPLHLAWGTGLAEWDGDNDQAHLKVSLRPETALVNEIGRRKINIIGFATPNPDGELVVPTGLLFSGEVEVLRYSIADTPTPNLYLKVAYDFGDACKDTIREVGLFMATEVDQELPLGQRYFTPEQLADPGILISIQRLNPVIARSPATRQEFEFVLPI